MSLPIAWVLKDKYILLVGGGEVAETRVRKLVDEGCHLVVIAPKLTEYIQGLVDDGRISWIDRTFQTKDLDMKHWSFVLTAIDDHETSKEIARLCRKSHIPVNVADVIPLCDFYFGANFQQGPLKVMVSTGSGAPRLAKRVLNELSSHASRFRYGDAIANVSKLRTILREQLPQNHPKVSQVRMSLMKSLCDRLTFTELAELKDEEMAPLIRGMILSTAACPARPVGEIGMAADFVEAPDSIERRTKKKVEDLGPIRDSPNSDSSSGSTSTSDSDSDSEPDNEPANEPRLSSGSESNDSKKLDIQKRDGNKAPKRMKRKATECAPGHPQPKLPPFPFR